MAVECSREGEGSADAGMERMVSECGKGENGEDGEEKGEGEEEVEKDGEESPGCRVLEVKSTAEKKVQQGEGGEGKFMKEVMEAVRLTRQPTPWMLRREKLVRMIKREMERGIARPGSFVAESLRYNQNLARAYLRFGVQSCPPKEELAVRENRLLRRKMMMLSQEE